MTGKQADCRAGAVADVARLLGELAPSSVVLVTGGDSYRASGAAAVIDPALEGRDVARYTGTRPNPTDRDVAELAGLLRAKPSALVLAVGGGSVIDIAKAARGLMQADDVRAAIVAGDVEVDGRTTLVAVPTTAGSGSEATHFAAIYVEGVKNSVSHPSLRPDVAVLDPDLTASMPPRLTAETGLDALAQAMESFWSTQSTEESRGLASSALRFAWANLPAAVAAPSEGNREAMCQAAHLAGRAIDVSKTTAAHALSYSMTVRHGVAHGHAVALTLGSLLELNAGVTEETCVDPRGVEFVRQRMDEILGILGAATPSDGRRAVEDLLRTTGLETRLADLGVVTEADRRGIAESVDAARLANNPKRLGPTELTALVEGVA